MLQADHGDIPEKKGIVNNMIGYCIPVTRIAEGDQYWLKAI